MNKDFRADLHIHTNFSDGSDTPLKILELASAAKLSGLSITDHDTMQAYTPEFFSTAKEKGIEILMGVEVSSELEGLTVHVLAYAFDRQLQQFLDRVVTCRIERNRKILEKLARRGIVIDEKELHSSGPSQIIGRSHIASAMVKMKAVASTDEAFEKFLKDDAPCYASGGKFSPLEVIDAIHANKGKAVLAHPHLLKQGRFVKNLLDLPFDGLECHYGRLLPAQERPWIKLAAEHQWIATGGSDYHGTVRPYIPLGCSWVDESTFRKL